MTDDYLNRLLDDFATAEPREDWADVLKRARRARRRYVAVAVAVATLMLVPSAWAIQRALSTKHYVPSYAPSAAQIIDLSWSNPRRGWALLGRTCSSRRNRCAVVEETWNGGATWQQLSSLPAEIGPGSNGALSGYGGFCTAGHACVSHIEFVTRRVGYAYGSSLFMTTDGGRSWEHVSARPVESMAISGSKVFRLVYSHPGCPGPCAPMLQSSTPGTRVWAPVPVQVTAGNGNGETIYAAGRDLYVFSWGNAAGGVTSHAAIAVSRDRGRTWSTIADPCGSIGHEESDAVTASAVRDSLGVLCAPKSGGRPFVALSRDAARTFAKGTPLSIAAPEQIAISGSGSVAVANAGVTGDGPFTYTLSVSHDGGHTWKVAVRDRARVAIDLAAGFLQFISPHDLLWVGYPYSLWQSRNGGRTWEKRPSPRRGTSGVVGAVSSSG
ncbi:MAG TPA: sialidase family protein [Gaiellaceae bacterium]|nr:sialidase family protein [Gaiellaceae bacterium]